MRGAATDLMPLLARRNRLLLALEDGPRIKSDLVGALDVSRSTVDRSVRELQAKGIVERRNGGFRLTLSGRLLFEEFQAFNASCDGIAAAAGPLSVLGPDTDVDVTLLADAEVVHSDRTTPYRPAERFLELIRDADSAKILSTAISPQYVDVVHGEVIDAGLEYTVGATPSVVERLISEYRDELDGALSSGRFALRELADAPPFTIGVFDRPDGPTAGVLVYVNEGPRGYVGNDATAAVEWAEAYFRRYWTDGTPITAPVTER